MGQANPGLRAGDPACRRSEAEHALRDFPDTALVLGRRLESELGFRARAEVLQALVAVGKSGDPATRDRVRDAFGFHVVAVEALRDLWGAPALADALPAGGSAALAALLDERTRLDAGLVEASTSAPSDVRPGVDRARATLLPDVEALRAAAVLAGHFESALRELESPAEGASWAEELRPEDHEIVRAATRPEPSGGARPDRELVDALVLTVAMRRRLRALADSGAADGDPAVGALADDKVAYRHVSGRLQVRHGTYLEEERRGPAEVAERIRKTLFAVYLEATRVLNGEKTRAAATSTEGAESAGADLRQKIEAADRAAAEVRAEQRSQREIVERALERSREPEREVPESIALRDLRAERRRRTVLVAVAAALLIVSVAVQIVLRGGRAGSPAAPFAPVAAALPSSEVLPAGDVLTVELSTWVWKDMGPDERRTHVERAAEAARAAGARAMHLVDEQGAELARWTVEGGVDIAAR